MLVSVAGNLRGEPDTLLEEKKAVAQSLHENMLLMIERGESAKVPESFRKVLGLNFSGKYEKNVVDEAQILSERLCGKGHSDIALQVVDMALNTMREKDSRVRLLKEKGFIYKSVGQTEKAMEMFEKSKSLETAPR